MAPLDGMDRLPTPFNPIRGTHRHHHVTMHSILDITMDGSMRRMKNMGGADIITIAINSQPRSSAICDW
jgi:hypothetical protein